MDATECSKCGEQFWSTLRLPSEEEGKELPKGLPGMEEEGEGELVEEEEKKEEEEI